METKIHNQVILRSNDKNLLKTINKETNTDTYGVSKTMKFYYISKIIILFL